MERKIRRLENSLVISGWGIIGFAVWSLVKSLMYIGMNDTLLSMIQDIPNSSEIGNMVLIFTLGFAYGTMILDVVLRVFTGRQAIAEGKGARKGRGYLVLAFLLALISLLSIAVLVWIAATGQSYSTGIADMVVSTIVELTSLGTLLDLIITSIRIKKIRKQADREEVLG